MAAKILLVEDDAQIAFIVKETLEEKDYEVTWATTGLEGLEDFKLVQYDLVLIDLMLPEMDGYSLCNSYPFPKTVAIHFGLFAESFNFSLFHIMENQRQH